jgi:hypothetical protein
MCDTSLLEGLTMGIDYGMGRANVDLETGIRFGVISAHSLSGWVCGEAEPIYPDEVEVECPECGAVWQSTETCGSDTQICPQCEHDFECSDLDELEPIGWNYAPNDADYQTDYSESLNCVFVLKSPYFTYGRYCSPCAPGAVDLDNAGESGDNRGYCFGHDYFEDGKAPYPVFRVSDGSRVETPAKSDG